MTNSTIYLYRFDGKEGESPSYIASIHSLEEIKSVEAKLITRFNEISQNRLQKMRTLCLNFRGEESELIEKLNEIVG